MQKPDPPPRGKQSFNNNKRNGKGKANQTSKVQPPAGNAVKSQALETRPSLNQPRLASNSQPSSFSQNGSSSRRKTCFLDLPGEIRNQIYLQIFDSKQLVAIRPQSTVFDNHPMNSRFLGVATAPKALKTLAIKLNKATSVKGYFKKPGSKPLPVEGVLWKSSSINLLLTCKAVSKEAATYIYGNNAFVFEDASRLNGFMKISQPKSLVHVREISLLIQSYGIPYTTADTAWENKHVQRWTSTLTRLAETMPNLKILRLHLHFPNLAGYINRALRSVNEADTQKWLADAAPLLMTLPLSKLEHLKTLSIRTSSQLLRSARNDSLIEKLYLPHFQAQGIHNPTRHQNEVLYIVNRSQIEALHVALDKSLKELIRNGDCSMSDFKTAAKEWREYAKDPIGKSLALPPAAPHGSALYQSPSMMADTVYTAPGPDLPPLDLPYQAVEEVAPPKKGNYKKRGPNKPVAGGSSAQGPAGIQGNLGNGCPGNQKPKNQKYQGGEHFPRPNPYAKAAPQGEPIVKDEAYEKNRQIEAEWQIKINRLMKIRYRKKDEPAEWLMI